MPSKKKVAHVINDLDGGGAQKLLSELLPLLNTSIQVDLIVLTSKKIAFLEAFIQNNINVIILSKNRSVYSPFHIFKLRTLIKNYDIVHSHLFPTQYWVSLANFFNSVKVTLVTTEHNTFNTRMKYSFFRPIERFIYSHYHKIVSISLETQSKIASWIGMRNEISKFVVIQNGINIAPLLKAAVIPHSHIAQNINEDSKLIIMVARFNEQKDQATVIRTMLLLPDNYVLLLVGAGHLVKNYKQMVEDYKLKNKVIFLGFRNDVANLIKSSYISIVSSHWEGFGLVAIESMAAGIPVIAGNVPGLDQVVEGAGLLFDMGNDQTLAEIIGKLDKNSDWRKEIIDRQYQRALQYDIKHTAEAHLKLYRSLTENNE